MQEPTRQPELCHRALENGARCQAPARRGTFFCRHHIPKTRIPPPKPAPARFTDPWRAMHVAIAAAPNDDLYEFLEQTMDAVGLGHISHRRAGALLAAIHRRRIQLEQEHHDRRFRAFCDQVLQAFPAGVPGAIQDPSFESGTDEWQDREALKFLKRKVEELGYGVPPSPLDLEREAAYRESLRNSASRTAPSSAAGPLATLPSVRPSA